MELMLSLFPYACVMEFHQGDRAAMPSQAHRNRRSRADKCEGGLSRQDGWIISVSAKKTKPTFMGGTFLAKH